MRRRLVTAALLSSALGLPAHPQALQPFATLAGPSDTPVEIEADRMTYGYGKKVLELEGNVVARRAGGIVRAGSGTYDRANGKLWLKGGVLAVQGRQVFIADQAYVDLNAHTAEFRGGTTETATTTNTIEEQQGTRQVKKVVTTTVTATDMPALYLKELPANPAAPRAGKNSLIVHGSTVQQRADGSYWAQNVHITPCDCAGEPDFELLANEARLEGDRAHLSGVKLHFPEVTLPLFPVSLPLTSRQWGLLSPQFGGSSVTGFGFAIPVFVPLGESYDLTLTPGYFTGSSNATNTPAFGVRTVRGPRLGIEGRYAPAVGTSGSINLDLLYDLDQRDSPAQAPFSPGEAGASAGRGFGGLRGIAHVQHRTQGEDAVFALQGAVANDVMVLADAEPFSLDRFVDYLRTDVGAYRAKGATTLGLDATLMQDMRVTNFSTPDRRLFGPERRSTFDRLPALFAQVAPVPAGPVSFSMETSVAQYAPFSGPDALERSTGFAPTDIGATPALPVLGTDAARAPTLRGDFAPRLAWALPQGFPLDLRLDLGGRADGYIPYGFAERDRTRGYLDAGAVVGFPLERRFDSFLHRIEPQLELRAITRSIQSGGPPIGDPADAGGAQYTTSIDRAQQNVFPCPAQVQVTSATTCAATADHAVFGVPSARRPFDEIDFAAPSTGAVEAVASLDQTLWHKQGKTAVRWLRVNLEQDFLLGSGGGGSRLGEASALASVQGGTYGVSGLVRYDWSLHALSMVSSGGFLRDARTDELHVSLLLLRGASSERLRAGIDELFSAAQLDALAGQLSGSAGIGASAPLIWNFRLAYDFARYLAPGGTLPAGFPDFVHAASLTYDTPCHCAAIGVTASFALRDGALLPGNPTYHFVLDLKSLGSFATF